MPVQAAQWTEFLSCPICYNEFDENVHKPISLGCSHTVCKTCLNKLHRKACPFDQTAINTDIDVLPVNFALLQLVGAQVGASRSPCCPFSQNYMHLIYFSKFIPHLASLIRATLWVCVLQVGNWITKSRLGQGSSTGYGFWFLLWSGWVGALPSHIQYLWSWNYFLTQEWAKQISVLGQFLSSALTWSRGY